MSKPVKTYSPLRHIVSHGNGNYYLVDTSDIGGTWETMAFKCDKAVNVKSWKDRYCEWNRSGFRQRHNYIICNLEEFIR